MNVVSHDLGLTELTINEPAATASMSNGEILGQCNHFVHMNTSLGLQNLQTR